MTVNAVLQDMWFKPIVEQFPEGIVVMDEDRVIHFLNQQAVQLTNWQVGQKVPHCLYCQARRINDITEPCILSQDDPIPVFQTQMPTLQGQYETFELKTSKVVLMDGKTYLILILNHPKTIKEQEKLKVQKLLMHETMQVQEVERKRIARELHDQIGQSVYSIFLGVQGMKSHLQSDKYIAHLLNMEKNIEQTLDDIKRLTKELRPQILDNLGLQNALQAYVEDWEKTYQIEFELIWHVDERSRLTKSAELHLFRVIQEAVYNAVRHGNAKKIKLSFQSDKTQLHFSVIDDGIGFDPYNVRSRGLGLYHMSERMNMVRGTVQWDSQPGGPTKIVGNIPLAEEE